jgi:CheY-like chemotaxis protein
MRWCRGVDAVVPEQSEPLRVLVVDDEPSIVDVITMALRHQGYDVTAAETGVRALSEARMPGALTRWCPHAMVPSRDGALTRWRST